MNNGTLQKPDFWGYFCTFVMDYACRGRRRDTVHTPTKGPLHIVHLAGKTGWMVYNSLHTVGGNSIPAACFCGPDGALRFSFSCPFACWIALWFEFCGFAGKQEMALRLPYARRNGFVQNGCLHVDRSENTSAAVPLAVGSLDFARDDHTGTVMSRDRSDSRHPLVEARLPINTLVAIRDILSSRHAIYASSLCASPCGRGRKAPLLKGRWAAFGGEGIPFDPSSTTCLATSFALASIISALAAQHHPCHGQVGATSSLPWAGSVISSVGA